MPGDFKLVEAYVQISARGEKEATKVLTDLEKKATQLSSTPAAVAAVATAKAPDRQAILHQIEHGSEAERRAAIRKLGALPMVPKAAVEAAKTAVDVGTAITPPAPTVTSPPVQAAEAPKPEPLSDLQQRVKLAEELVKLATSPGVNPTLEQEVKLKKDLADLQKKSAELAALTKPAATAPVPTTAITPTPKPPVPSLFKTTPPTPAPAPPPPQAPAAQTTLQALLAQYHAAQAKPGGPGGLPTPPPPPPKTTAWAAAASVISTAWTGVTKTVDLVGGVMTKTAGIIGGTLTSAANVAGLGIRNLSQAFSGLGTAMSIAASISAVAMAKFVQTSNPGLWMQFQLEMGALTTTLGQMLEPVLQRVTKYVRQLADFLYNLDPATKRTIAALAVAVTVITTGVAAVAASVAALGAVMSIASGGIIPLLGIIGTVALGVATGMDVAAGKGDFLASAWKRLKDIGETLRPVFEHIKAVALSAASYVAEVWTAIKPTVLAVVGKLVESVVVVWQGIRPMLAATFQVIGPIAKKALGAVVGFILELPDRLREIMPKVQAFALQVVAAVKPIWDQIVKMAPLVGSVIVAAVQYLPEVFSKILAFIVPVVTKTLEFAEALLKLPGAEKAVAWIAVIGGLALMLPGVATAATLAKVALVALATSPALLGLTALAAAAGLLAWNLNQAANAMDRVANDNPEKNLTRKEFEAKTITFGGPGAGPQWTFKDVLGGDKGETLTRLDEEIARARKLQEEQLKIVDGFGRIDVSWTSAKFTSANAAAEKAAEIKRWINLVTALRAEVSGARTFEGKKPDAAMPEFKLPQFKMPAEIERLLNPDKAKQEMAGKLGMAIAGSVGGLFGPGMAGAAMKIAGGLGGIGAGPQKPAPFAPREPQFLDFAAARQQLQVAALKASVGAAEDNTPKEQLNAQNAANKFLEDIKNATEGMLGALGKLKGGLAH